MSINGGDAAEQMVKMATTGAEMALRLVGDTAKTIAMLLIAMAQKSKEKGEVRVISFSPEQYKQFKKLAGKRKMDIEHKVVKDKANGTYQVLFYANDAAKVNEVLERMGYARPQPEAPAQEVQEIKKNTPSGRSSADAKDRPSSEGQSKRQRQQRQSQSSKESVKAKLEVCRTQAATRNTPPQHNRGHRPRARSNTGSRA